MCMRLPLCIPALVAMGTVSACGSSLVLPNDGSPAELTAISGGGQEGTIGSRLEQPLVVRVTDAHSQPLAGVAVTFRFQTVDPAARLDSASVTDRDGRASTEVRLGVDVGSHVVEAEVAQAPAALRATFDLTAVAPGKGKEGKAGHGKDED